MYEIESLEMGTAWGLPVKMNFRKDTNDRLTAIAVMIADEYEAIHLPEAPCYIDIGSHIGTWGVMMGLRYPQAKVLCYEPLPENFKIIYLNKIANNLENLHPYMLAVSGTSEGEEEISYTDDSTKFGQEHKFVGSMQGGTGQKIKVKNISINDLLYNIEHCIMKIDCEGCEVKGFATLTPENFEKLDYVVGEFHPWTMDFKTFYKLFERTHEDISKDTGNTNLRNFMFKRKVS